MRVAIVAGEKSGDFIGSELIKAIRQRHPQAEFVGLAGPLMQAEGAESLADMDKISIFGLDGLFSSLAEILAIRRKLLKHFLNWQPDVFVGIDVPDFNLGLEAKLKRAGIPAVHYVSPTVWAWRSGRIRKIKRAVDLMLTLFPFEVKFYQQHDVPAVCVGHPLAHSLFEQQQPVQINPAWPTDYCLIGLLPGSRMSEIRPLAPEMIRGAKLLAQDHPNLRFVIPAASQRVMDSIRPLLDPNSDLIHLQLGGARDVLRESHLSVLASGTAALEAALLATPMVVMYRISKLSELVFKPSIRVEHYSMPNHLTERPVVPELVQAEATAERMQEEVDGLLTDADIYRQMKTQLAAVRPLLAMDSSELACDAIFSLIQKPE